MKLPTVKSNPFFLFLKSLSETFYSERFYGSYVKRGAGLGFTFVLVAAFLSAIQLLILAAPVYKSFVAEKDDFFGSLPSLTLEGGVLSSDEAMPIEVALFKNEEGGPLRVLIDLEKDTGNTARITKEMDDGNILALVTKENLFIYDKTKGKTEITPFADMKDGKITHEEWKNTGDLLVSLTPFSVFSFGIFIFFPYHLIAAFVGALLIFVASALFKIDLPFGGCMRLAAAAKIPGAFLLLFGTPSRALLLVLWAGYSVFGLLSVRKTEKINVNEP